MEIANKILKTGLIPWKTLQFFQSDNLKDLPEEGYEKLKSSLIKNSFIQTFNVWESGGETFLLDEHHRIKVLHNLEAEGYIVPEKFPANYIDCKDRKEASKFLLAYTSQYAKVNEEGLFEFMKPEGLDFEDVKFEVDIPNINFGELEDKFDLGDMGFQGNEEEGDEDEEEEEKPFSIEEFLGAEKFEEFQELFLHNKYNIPLVKSCNEIPEWLMEFGWHHDKHPKNSAVHFFLDDYKIDKAYSKPVDVTKYFEGYPYVLTPDFSVYIDHPVAVQIYQVYKQKWCGAFWNMSGYKVIPCVNWSDEKSYEFCFLGVEKNSVVACSARSLTGELEPLFWQGYEEMKRQIDPSFVIIYGLTKQIMGKMKDTNVKFYPDKWKMVELLGVKKLEGKDKYEVTNLEMIGEEEE